MRLKPSNGQRKPPGSKRRNPICLVAVEGKNKTEKNYVDSYVRNNGAKHDIHYVPGNYTDILNMIKVLVKEMEELGVNVFDGDLAYILADLDGIKHGKRLSNIEKGMKKCKGKGIKTILSNPCFEIWFLLHYEYTTAAFQNGEELIKRLRKHLPDYEKNQDVYVILHKETKKAIRNAKKLSKYQNELKKNELLQNPRTNMYEFIEDIAKFAYKNY